MTEQDKEEVRKIIRDELSFLIKNNKIVLGKPMQILDGNDIVIGQTNGTRFGTAASQPIAFYGSSPRVQFPTGFLVAASGGGTIDTQARARIADLNELCYQLGFAAR